MKWFSWFSEINYLFFWALYFRNLDFLKDIVCFLDYIRHIFVDMVTGTCFRYRFDIDFSFNIKKIDRYHKYVNNFILINLQFDSEYEWFAFWSKVYILALYQRHKSLIHFLKTSTFGILKHINVTLRRLGGQHSSHQICLKFLNMII